MKIVVNKCYGRYGVSEKAKELLKCVDVNDRESKELIALIEEKGSDFVSGEYAYLEIAEIPDESTDYYIDEYNGAETVIYVVDGKIFFA